MNRLRNIAAVLVLLTFTGCAPVVFLGGAAAGVAGYKYYDGALTVIYHAPFEKTFESAVKAVEALNYNISERHQKIGSGSIITTGTASERLKLTFEYVSPEETEVSIRVGIMGDESTSKVIKDKIADFVFPRDN